jgi:AraC-like DNA-binding protein
VSHSNARGRAEVLDTLTAAYPNATDFVIRSDDQEPWFACSDLQLPDLAIRRTSTTGYHCEAGPTDAIRVTLPTRGSVSVFSSGSKTVATAGVAGLVCSDRRVLREVLPDYSGYHIQISRDCLVRRAQLIVGGISTDDRVDPTVDLRSPAGAAFCRNVAAAFSEAEQLERLGVGSLVAANLGEIILTLAAVALLPGARRHLAEPANGAGAHIAERARQHLEQHAAHPVQLSALADQYGISLRALQLGFKRRFGCSLTDYLFDCRLRLARERLLSAPASSTVASVAIDCGFSNVGAFAARYRATYGELPSQTLRRAKS